MTRYIWNGRIIDCGHKHDCACGRPDLSPWTHTDPEGYKRNGGCSSPCAACDAYDAAQAEPGFHGYAN